MVEQSWFRGGLRSSPIECKSDMSANAAITKIIEDNGGCGGAQRGHMVFGPLEAFTPEQLAEPYDVIVPSTQRVNRAALPQWRKQKQGLVVWVSSGTRPVVLLLILHRILQRRRGWMLWRSCLLVSSAASSPLVRPSRSNRSSLRANSRTTVQTANPRNTMKISSGHSSMAERELPKLPLVNPKTLNWRHLYTSKRRVIGK
jgi:hypothetical protein